MTKAELIERVNGLTLFKETVRTTRKQYWQGVTDAQRMMMECVKQLPDEPQGQEQPQDDHRLDAFRHANLPMLQKGNGGLFYPCPIPVQQEPSPLEVALRLMTGVSYNIRAIDAAAIAFTLIDAVRAEEARRAGK